MPQTKIVVELEETQHLGETEKSLAYHTAGGTFPSLDAAEAELKALWPAAFVYRGGYHVSLHLRSGDYRRILLVSERIHHPRD